MSSVDNIVVELADEEATLGAAAKLAPLLRAGDLLLLHGDLGAGKTTFTRGLVDGLGSPAPVASPTVTLIHEYLGGRLPVVHVDAYRLGGAGDAESIGLLEYLDRGEALVIIEWSERIAEALPGEHGDVTLEEWEDGRRLTLGLAGESWAGRREALTAAMGEFGGC